MCVAGKVGGHIEGGEGDSLYHKYVHKTRFNLKLCKLL